MKKNVFVLGELNVDLIVTGKDVKPEWNREKLVDSCDLVLGSSSAITACGLARLGLNVYFVSVVGNDAFGTFATKELQRHGVDTRYVHKDETLRTGVGLSLSMAKDRALLTFMGSIPCLKPDHLPSEWMEEADHVHFGSYYLQEGMRLHWEPLFERAKGIGISTSFDTGWDPHEDWHTAHINRLLKHTDLFMPNEEEFNRLFGRETVKESLEVLPAERGWIAVKCGSKGAVLSRTPGELLESPAFPVVPIDTTGAGDSFNAAMIYAYLNGFEAERALRWANACGAIATQRIGGASTVPDRNEVEVFMELVEPRPTLKKET